MNQEFVVLPPNSETNIYPAKYHYMIENVMIASLDLGLYPIAQARSLFVLRVISESEVSVGGLP